jgi:hypothetical protein
MVVMLSLSKHRYRFIQAVQRCGRDASFVSMTDVGEAEGLALHHHVDHAAGHHHYFLGGLAVAEAGEEI